MVKTSCGLFWCLRLWEGTFSSRASWLLYVVCAASLGNGNMSCPIIAGIIAVPITEWSYAADLGFNEWLSRAPQCRQSVHRAAKIPDQSRPLPRWSSPQNHECLHDLTSRILDMHVLLPSHINSALNNGWDNPLAPAVFAIMVASTCTACAAESPLVSPDAIDHAGIIGSWNAESLARGEKLYLQRHLHYLSRQSHLGRLAAHLTAVLERAIQKRQ